MKTLKQNRNQKRGAALVEYGLIVAGVALVAAAAVSIFGQKTGEVIGATARILPGAHGDENKEITVGQIVRTDNSGATIKTDTSAAALDGNDAKINSNLGLNNAGELVDDPNH